MTPDELASLIARDPLLNVPEAAAYLRRTKGSIDQWRAEGFGPRFVKLGSRVAYRLSDLDRWIASHVVQPGRGRKRHAAGCDDRPARMKAVKADHERSARR